MEKQKRCSKTLRGDLSGVRENLQRTAVMTDAANIHSSQELPKKPTANRPRKFADRTFNPDSKE